MARISEEMKLAAEQLLNAMFRWLQRWIPDGNRLVPPFVLAALAQVEAQDCSDEREGQFQLQCSILAESVRSYAANNELDVQPDGTPGPRLDAVWRRVKLIGESLINPPDEPTPIKLELRPELQQHVDDVVDELPTPNQEECRMSESNGMISLLDQLRQVNVEDVDRGIAELQSRIDRLKQLRKLIAPKAAPATAATGESLDLVKVKAWLKAEGPARPGAIGKQFGFHSTAVGKALAKADSGFKRLDDGRFAAT